MNAMKQSLLERAPRLLATVLLCGLTSATRAMARGNPIAMPVRVWGYGNSNYYQGEPGELDLSSSFMPTTPGGTDGDLYLIGTKSGTGTFYTANPGNQMALMEPGKSYSLGVDAFSVTSVTFCISPPPGYTVEINGVNRGSYTVSVSSPWSYSNTFTIRLLGPMNSMTGRAGAASSFTNGRVHWRAALGSLRNGRSAGSLAIVDAGRDPTWSSVYTPASLQYETPSAEVTVYRSSGNIRQILANEACVDVVTTNSTTYHLDFYSVDQVSGSGFPHTFTGQPYVKYTVTQDGSGNKLKITSETRSITSATDTTTGVARTAVTTLERTGTWPAFTWTMNDWNDSGQTQLVEDYRTWSANGSNAHAETTTVLKPGDSTNATYATKAYTHYDWGEELTNETNGSAGSNPTTTTYDFNTSSSAFGSYGFVNSASTTGGGWTACEYSTASSPSSNYIGVVKRIHRPFNDSPSSVPGTLSTNTSGEITAYDYTTDSFGMRTRPTSIQTKVNNVVTASAAISYGNETANSKAVVVATRQDQSDSAGNYLTTVTRYYREDVADDFFRNQIHSVTQPDGTKQSCAYQRGTWASGSFTTGSGSCTRAAVINGTTNSSGNATCSSLNGYTVDTVYLVSNRSTMDVTIRDAKGHVVHTETDVWDGNAWQQTAYVDYTYNICNQLTNRSARNGAQYDATYSGELKNSETDEAGVQTTYAYDYAGRVDTATKVGYSATPISIGDLVTKYLYDAASRVTEVHWGYGQTEQMIAYSAYDDAGRVTSETPAGLGATTYTYNPSDRARTATIPDGNNSTRVETYQPDGRLASITGTAVVPSYYSYSVAGDGTLTTQVFSGTSNSSRWSKTTTDWLGRKITTDQPGFSVSSQADCTIQYAYNTTTGQLLTVTPTNTAPTRYAYSSLGLISSTGLDLDNNGLGASSGDRMADQEHFFENDGTDWWLRDETYVYATAGSSTRTLVGVTRQRLTGFPANRLAETKTTDADGNITTRTVDVARSSKTLTNTTASSGQTQTQTETVVDGLSLSLVTFQNLDTIAA